LAASTLAALSSLGSARREVSFQQGYKYNFEIAMDADPEKPLIM